MYRIVIGALLLFPWLLAIYIAFGAFRAARKKRALHKRCERMSNGPRACMSDPNGSPFPQIDPESRGELIMKEFPGTPTQAFGLHRCRTGETLPIEEGVAEPRWRQKMSQSDAYHPILLMMLIALALILNGCATVSISLPSATEHEAIRLSKKSIVLMRLAATRDEKPIHFSDVMGNYSFINLDSVGVAAVELR